MKTITSFLFLLSHFLTPSSAEALATSTRLLEDYDQTIPPNGVDITYIDFDIELASVKSIKEKKMHLSLFINEYYRWNDTRLAYQDLDWVNEWYQDNFVDFTYDRYSLWIPTVGYTEENEKHNSSEVVMVFPNGSVLWRRKLSLTITCDFDYGNLPSDAHDCETVAYI